MLPREVVDEVRSRTDIAEVVGRHVTLRRNGRSWTGLCPFHTEKTASFHVVPEKQIFHCFGCGASGDAFTFLQKMRGLSFMDAVRELAGGAGIKLPERELSPEERRKYGERADLHDAVDTASRFYENMLMVRPEGEVGRRYLETRGISVDTARACRLGFAPPGWNHLSLHLQRQRVPVALALKAGLVKQKDRNEGGERQSSYDTFRNRILFPILDDRGRPVAFGGRTLPGDDGPKYLNSPESDIYEKSKTLYGLYQARGAIQRRDRAILVEGYFDAVSLWQAGFGEAVATCGTALTPAHAEVLKRLTRKVIAQFDGDEAGQRAAVKSMELFLDAGIEASRLALGDAKDPDEFIQKSGPAAFEEKLAHTEPLVELVWRRKIREAGSGSAARSRALELLVPILRRLPDAVAQQEIPKVAGTLGIRDDELWDWLRRTPAPRAPEVRPPRSAWTPPPDLEHLLWLVMHHAETVAPQLETVEPDDVSTRPDVLGAISQLAAGVSPAVIAADCADPELSRLLTRLAAESVLYKDESAATAARQILARMALRRVEADILATNAKIASCHATGDKSSYATLTRLIVDLQKRRTQLGALAVRRGRPGS